MKRTHKAHASVTVSLRQKGHHVPMDLSVIVPCYNEGDSLPHFLKVAAHDFNESGLEVELILVNDGSADNTQSIIDDFVASGVMAHVCAVKFSRNFGKEASMLAGLRESTGDVCSFIDADLQQLPSTLLEMYKRLMADDTYDVVCAYQEQREGGARSWLSARFYGVFNRMSTIQLEPDASDFRVFRRVVADALLAMPEYHRFTKGLFSWVGFETLAIPYVPEARDGGESKWSVRSLARYALGGMVSFSTAPLRLSMAIGSITALVGMAYFFVLLFDTFVLKNTPSGYPTLLAVMLILGGMILLSLGIIGQYLGRIYIESKRRPIYIASRVVRADDGKVSKLPARTNEAHFSDDATF